MTKNKPEDFSDEELDEELKELVEIAGGKDTKMKAYPPFFDEKANRAQADLTRILILSINKLEKTTSKYSKILIWLTGIMTIAVIIQVILLWC